MNWTRTRWFCWILLSIATIVSGIYLDKTAERIGDAVYFMGVGLVYHWWADGGGAWIMSLIHRATAPD